MSARRRASRAKQSLEYRLRFVDYDRDGRLDLFVANYIDMDLKTAPVPESGRALQGRDGCVRAAGIEWGKNILYHNNGDGTFTDVSRELDFKGERDLRRGRAHADLDNDGWPTSTCQRFHRECPYQIRRTENLWTSRWKRVVR